MSFFAPRARRLTAGLAAAALPLLLPASGAVAGLRPVPVPEGVVIGATSPDAIPGHYIVLLKKTGAEMASAESLVTDGIDQTYGSISGFSATLSPVQARRLAANPAVRMVEQDQRVQVDSYTQKVSSRSWNLDRIDQRKLPLSRTYTPADDGSSVHAYVIDTGIRISHLDFGGRARNGYDFVDRDRVAQDCDGHGTHVAGTIGGSIFGVAKKVQLVAVRVMNCAGSGSISDVIAGVNWVTRNAVKPAVANMSLGAPKKGAAQAAAALDQAIAASIASGVTYTIAAGNDGADARNYSPADVAAALTVGATDSTDTRAKFSNFGRRVDLFAPGVNIWSDSNYGNDYIELMSGTSMAAPMVAGAAALVLDANPAWSPAQVGSYLIRTSTPGRVKKAGRYSPNRLLFVSAPPAAPVVAATGILAAQTGTPYSHSFAVTAPRRGFWRVTSGTLPDGLTLSSAGVLSGTPTSAGQSIVTVAFTDYVPNTATRAVTINVS
jgi:subtilisin family serine protease